MAATIGSLKLRGKVFVQFEGGELTEVGTIEVPLNLEFVKPEPKPAHLTPRAIRDSPQA